MNEDKINEAALKYGSLCSSKSLYDVLVMAFIRGGKWQLEQFQQEQKQLIEALEQISQMSDCGSYEQTIVRMKDIAVNALNKLND